MRDSKKCCRINCRVVWLSCRWYGNAPSKLIWRRRPSSRGGWHGLMLRFHESLTGRARLFFKFFESLGCPKRKDKIGFWEAIVIQVKNGLSDDTHHVSELLLEWEHREPFIRASVYHKPVNFPLKYKSDRIAWICATPIATLEISRLLTETALSMKPWEFGNRKFTNICMSQLQSFLKSTSRQKERALMRHKINKVNLKHKNVYANLIGFVSHAWLPLTFPLTSPCE